MARCCTQCNGNKGSLEVLLWYRPQLFWTENREKTLFEWMRFNADMDDAMIALEQSLREGRLDKEALEELRYPAEKKEPTYWDTYCSAYPSEPECRVYDC